MTINLIVRQRDIQYIIYEDPWDVWLYHEGRTPDDAEVTFSFVGRIVPLGSWTTARGMGLNVPKGEIPPGTYGWMLLAPHNIPTMFTNDSVKAVQISSGISREFRVGFCTRYAYKYEVILDERE